MKRLVTQFDDARTRATQATPTCCCCCCCCIISTLTGSTVSAVTAYQGAQDSGRGAGHAWFYAVAAFLAFPAALTAGFATGEPLGWGAAAVALTVLLGLVLLVYIRAGVAGAGRKALIPFGIAVVAFPLEVYVGIVLLFNSEVTAALYFAAAVAVPVAVGFAMRRRRRSS